MALANYFDKSALAASQILNGYNRTEFETKLLKCPIEVAFDQHALQSHEGKATLDLTIRLLARLYPHLIITTLGDIPEKPRGNLIELALSINPVIEFREESPAITVVIGNSKVQRETPVFYIGSDNWIVRFSPKGPVSSANTFNPFAAGAAACFGAANVFRHVFRDQLPSTQLDDAFDLSLLDYERNQNIDKNPTSILGIEKINLNETILVGLGAIGNGVIWGLSKIPQLEGTFHLVDPEKIDLSNLQRYVLTQQINVYEEKSVMAANFLSSTQLRVIPYTGDWATFLNSRGNWMLESILVAVDNAHDRIMIQGSLPKQILNAWTQTMDLGISRHEDFLKDACLACLYPARNGPKSESVLISESFGLINEEMQIREMLFNNTPVDNFWLTKIAEAKSVSVDELSLHHGKPIRAFYHDVFCGGVLLSNDNNQQVETPMAFQSALAGILLASELVINKAKLRSQPITSVTRIDLLRPLGEYLNEAVLKRETGGCICHDEDFRIQYEKKYS